VRYGDIFIFCSHYYRSKAIGRANPGWYVDLPARSFDLMRPGVAPPLAASTSSCDKLFHKMYQTKCSNDNVSSSVSSCELLSCCLFHLVENLWPKFCSVSRWSVLWMSPNLNLLCTNAENQYTSIHFSGSRTASKNASKKKKKRI